MKRHDIILIFGFTVVLFACTPSTDKQAKNIEQTTSPDNISLTKTQNVKNESEQEKDNYCVRGQAKPVVQKENYPNTAFILQPDSVTAIETVTFDDGDKLIIRNWGCEYYILTFRFETTKYQRDTLDLAFWFRTAGTLMTGMLGGLDAPMDIKRGLVMLESYISGNEKNGFKNLQLGEEIDFGGNDIRSFVTVDRIEIINDKKFGVTVSFATGPL